MANVYELQARYDSRQSFYRKAEVQVNADGSKFLYSYDTLVAALRPDGTLKINGVWSQTTSRHQREFMRQEGFAVPSPLRSGIYTRDGEKIG